MTRARHHRQQRRRQVHAGAPPGDCLAMQPRRDRRPDVAARMELTPVEVYNGEHAREENWIIDGLGRLDSIPARLARATDIVLVDMPLWVHFWLAAERQIAWAAGSSSFRRRDCPRCRQRKRCSGPSGRSIRPGCRKSDDSLRWRSSGASECFGWARLLSSTDLKAVRNSHRNRAREAEAHDAVGYGPNATRPNACRTSACSSAVAPSFAIRRPAWIQLVVCDPVSFGDIATAV
jgi:hypothetical protein